jgi:hypothetical protein
LVKLQSYVSQFKLLTLNSTPTLPPCSMWHLSRIGLTTSSIIQVMCRKYRWKRWLPELVDAHSGGPVECNVTSLHMVHSAVVLGSMGSMWSRNSSVGVATGYGLDGWVWFPVRTRNLSLLHSVQTGSGTHPTSPPMSIEGCFPEGKASGSYCWPLISI